MPVSLRELLEVGAHVGNLRGKSHPASSAFVFTIKDGVMVINLEKTREKLTEVIEVMRKWREEGKTILFVGTKPQAKESVKAVAVELGYPYVTERWLGGLLTNFETVKKSLTALEDLEKKINDPNFTQLSKREQRRITERREKLLGTLEGVANLTKLPDALFVVDSARESIAVSEANRLGIPVVAILDTKADPTKVSHAIPLNDDSKRAVELVMGAIRDGLMGKGVSKTPPIKAEEKSKKAAKKHAKKK
jgi:small subunit ribosomal protein S2